MPTPRPYQLEPAVYVLDKKRVLLADDMGLGKCVEAIIARRAVTYEHGAHGKTLLICGGSVREHWMEEIRLWSNGSQPTVTQIQTTSFQHDLHDAKKSDYV